MIKKVPDFQFRESRPHPWDQWFSGEKLLLEKGKDYTCTDRTLVAAAHASARKRGIRVRTSVIKEGTVVLQALFNEQAPKTTPSKKTTSKKSRKK